MSFEILPQGLAIKGMRDNGYKNTAYAIAELIDNSIQAGEDVNKKTNVEVICVDVGRVRNSRQVKEIDRILVYDDAGGMDEKLLRSALQFGVGTRLEKKNQKGMGKFGMGLPNSSISQCSKVEVWSWRNGNTFYTYLDVGEVQEGTMKEVPRPKSKEIPSEYKNLLKSKLKKHGTLVVWSKLDRVKWKTSKALFNNSESLVGRMYRYFIAGNKAGIRLASYVKEEGGAFKLDIDRFIRPNDPMYLMVNTSVPKPYDEEPAFQKYKDDDEVTVTGRDGEEGKIVIKYSVCKQQARNAGGHSEIGKHAAKNQGVSIVRAGRELELDRSMVNISDTRERWWGIEIHFDSTVDHIMGVTNNKQAATNFELLNLAEDAKNEGVSPVSYKQMLKEDGDNRLVFYEISDHVTKALKNMRELIEKMGKSKKKADDPAPPGSPEDIAGRVTKKRREKLGDVGKSDEDEKKNDKERGKGLADFFTGEGESEAEAEKKALEIIKKKIKFQFKEGLMPSKYIFDCNAVEGVLIIKINQKHPVYNLLFGLLDKEKGEGRPQSENDPLVALKLLFLAWARMEDIYGDENERLEEIRSEWGTIARDFLKEYEEF